MRPRSIAPTVCLFGSLAVLTGCFDRDDSHPAKDADESKPSLQMQQHQTPAPQPAPGPEPMPQDNKNQ